MQWKMFSGCIMLPYNTGNETRRNISKVALLVGMLHMEGCHKATLNVTDIRKVVGCH